MVSLEHPVQSFRIAPQCLSPTSTESPLMRKLATRVDTESGQHFILWIDVQSLFANATCVMDKGVMVYFMEDENFKRLDPLRIAYHPDVILDVVLDSPAAATPEPLPSVQVAGCNQGPVLTGESPFRPADPHSLLSEHGLPLHDLESSVSNLNVHEAQDAIQKGKCSSSATAAITKGKRPLSSMSIRAQASVHTFQELHSNCVQAIMKGQVTQAEGIKAEMSRHFQDVKAETDKLNAATGKIATLQAKVVKMNETMLDLQKMTLDRLANIQTQIQVVLTQTYELHEYPIPRLFIILPKMARKRDTLLKPFSNQFRLYFLCECGLHTTKEGSKEIDQVHLANHPGYDIDRPTEFLTKYGPYVLAVMRAVQLGARIASMIVPHLANSTLAHELKVAELGLKSLQEGIDFYTKENIGMMVDKTVLYLEDLNKYHDEQEVEGDVQSSMSQSILDDAKAIEGVELKQLANFLSVADNGHMLGNLYRSVTKEGHAKWICRTHYRQNYREEARRLFCEVVEENCGLFEEQKGKLTISLASRTLANAFYTVLIQVQFVQELDICFLWDYTQADLRVFTQAILESTVVSLSFDGKDFVGPPSDLFNRGRRYDPLLQLLADGRLWMAQFANLGVGHSGDALTYYDFLGRTSNLYTIKVVPMLRALDMSQVIDDAGLILELTRKCISLQKLSVSMRRGDFVLKCIETCPSLQQLEVYRRNLGDLTVKDILDLIDRVVALKVQSIRQRNGSQMSLQTLHLTNPITSILMTLSEDGLPSLTLISPNNRDLRPFFASYGWAIKEISIITSKWVFTGDSPRIEFGFGQWAQSVADHGGKSGLESFKFDGRLLTEQSRTHLLSVMDMSPKLQDLELILTSDRQPHRLVSNLSLPGDTSRKEATEQDISTVPYEKWCLNHLGSRLTKLEIQGSLVIIPVIAVIADCRQVLQKLVEITVNLGQENIPHRLWQRFFSAIDFSVLTILTIDCSEFGQYNWDIFLGCLSEITEQKVEKDSALITLTKVNLKSTALAKIMDVTTMQVELAARAPLAKLMILDDS